MQSTTIYIIGLIVATFIGIVGFSFFLSSNKEKKYSQEFQDSANDVLVEEMPDNRLEEKPSQSFSAGDYNYDSGSLDTLLLRENVKASIDLDDILSGGVGKDGIPSIQEPRLALVSAVPEWLNPSGDGLVVQRNGEARFYPYQVLVGHEIVNDTLAGEPLLVTYCPLCFTGVVYDPTIDGTVIDFGVSGKLWESNLLMYNRSNPESLWSQALGEAVVGPATGRKLPVVRFDITTYEKFASTFPEGSVVVGDSEVDEGSLFARSYARIPYGGDLRDIDPYFPFSGVDDRLEKTDIVLGLVHNNQAKAYLVSSLVEDREVTDVVGGDEITIFYNQDSGIVEFYVGSRANGERLNPIPSFWISWVSIHSDTAVRK